MNRKSYVAGAAQVKGNFTVLADGDVAFTLTTPSDKVAETIQEYIGTGNIRKNARAGQNTSYKYVLQRRADVDALARILLPSLIEQARVDAEAVRAHLDSWFDEVDPASPQRQNRVTL